MSDSPATPEERNAKAEREAVIGTVVAVAVGALVAWAGSQGSHTVGGWPVFAIVVAFSFGLNWLVFIHAWFAQTEHYFDLTGSLTYISATALALWLVGDPDPRALLIGACVAIWAARLGSFLFKRVKQQGKDGRFDALKVSFPRFLMTWTLQGLWVSLTMAAGFAAITSAAEVPLGLFALVGGLVWLAGFAIEAVADAQKTAFRADPANEGQFITTGLWAWSRHPNYFGEITLWLGIAIIAVPTLSGWMYATLISPVFVFVLLTRISGIPMLESRGKRRWGHDPEYQAYRENTPVLVLRPPRTA